MHTSRSNSPPPGMFEQHRRDNLVRRCTVATARPDYVCSSHVRRFHRSIPARICNVLKTPKTRRSGTLTSKTDRSSWPVSIPRSQVQLPWLYKTTTKSRMLSRSNQSGHRKGFRKSCQTGQARFDMDSRMHKELTRRGGPGAGNEPARSATRRVVVKLAAGRHHVVGTTATG